MLSNISDTVTLNNGVKMPWLGLGTFRSTAGEVEAAIRWAIEAGYRHIDTAAAYDNEDAIGAALKDIDVPRSELFITTKLWNETQRQGTDAVLWAFDESLKKLQVDYVDLYLIHWPVKGRYKESWKLMERFLAEKRVRAIGVSNFLIHHLEDLKGDSQTVPAVNQVEFHPLLRQPELLEYCQSHGIQHEAWSPLMKGTAEQIPVLVEIGEKHDKTASQVTLRWAMQKGSVVIPKSVHRQRIFANAAIFDFELSGDEMAAIDNIGQEKRFGPHPDTFTF